MRRLETSLQRLLLLCCLWLCACAVQAATYSSAATSFNWIDPATHTAVVWTNPTQGTSGVCDTTGDDSITALINIGFTFNFGGVNYTQLRIMSNGRVQFNNTYCYAGTQAVGPPRTYTLSPLPNANLVRTMRVYGADIDTTPNGSGGGPGATTCPPATCSVRYTITPLGTAPNRQFVVTWVNTPDWGSTGSYYNFQVILNEDGSFIYQYGPSNNPDGGKADIGWEVATTDYGLYTYTNIGSLNNTAIRFFIPATLAEYQLEESAWSGANSVVNTTSASFYGTPVGAVAPTANGYICRGASIPLNTANNTIDAINTNINLYSSTASAGSVSFWYKGNTAWNDGNDRMLLDATANNSAPFFFMKRTDGSLRFVLQDSANNVFVSVGGTHAFAANTWHHLAVTWALGASARMSIYLDGALDKQSSLVTSSSLSSLIGALYFGDNQGKAVSNNPTSNSADGTLDEVRVYNYEIPLTVVNRDYLASHPCTSTLNNFLISVGASTASTCQPKSISITARDAGNATLTTYSGTVSLSTSTGHGDWSKVTANGTLTNGGVDSGAASYTFASADNGTLTLALSDTHADDLSVSVNDASASIGATSSTINFRDNVFVITPTDSLGTTVVAARPHALKAELWRKDPSTGTCSIASAYAGTKSLQAWLTRDAADPGGVAPTVTSVAPPTLATTSLPNAQPGAANFSLSFTAGVANFTLGTGDVGKYALNLLDATRTFATAVDIPGASSTLTARPFGLAFTSLMNGATANPGGANPTDAVFTKAGQPFQATVGAYLWQAADDANNDGIPDAGTNITNNGLATHFAWPVTLTAALNTPAGGVVGAVGGTNPIAQASFSGGTATVSDLTYSEVGSMTLAASASSYLNSAGVNPGGSSSIVGRFTPDHFDVGYNTPEFTTGCAPGGFTYMGKAFNFTAGKAPVMTVSARSASAGTPITQNYSGAFWKLTNSTLTGRSYNTASGTLDTTNLPPTSSDPAIVDTGNGVFTSAGSGTGTLTFSAGTGLAFQHTTPAAPFNAEISLGLNVIDADGIAFAGNPATFGATTPGNGIAFSSGKEMRFGRLALQNAYGSELLPLPINLTAEYYVDLGGSPPGTNLGFVTNTADICTTVNAANVTVSPNTPLLPGDTTLTVASPTLTNGSWHVSPSGPYSQLSAPGAGKQGSVDLSIDLDAAGLGWLKYNWSGSVYGNPGARAVFGIYQGPERQIYMHERFN
jgi:MSHA biogenesis protein MshQ